MNSISYVMKYLIFSIFSLISALSSAQAVIHSMDTINENHIYIDSSNTDNFLWQIGNTSKSFFDSTWCLVTDTTNMYDSLADAKVNFLLTSFQNYSPILKFDHKIDTDIHHAGGYIEFNIDNDSTYYYYNGIQYSSWNFIVNLNHYPNYITDLGHHIDGWTLINSNYYNGFGETTGDFSSNLTNYDTLFNGVYGFTGQSNDWMSSEIWFLYAQPLKTNDTFDTLNVTFHFISDSLSNNRNGWAIKNIQSGYGMLYGSVNEITNNIEVKTYPNPTQNSINIDINNPENKIVTIDVFSVEGKKIATYRKQGKQFSLDLSKLERGTYFLTYTIDHQSIGYSKVNKL